MAQESVLHPLHDPRGHGGPGRRLCDGASARRDLASRKAESAYARWLASLRSPWSVAFHIVLLANFVYHTWSWFQIMPKTMPMIVIGGKRLQRGSHHRGGDSWPPPLRLGVLFSRWAGHEALERPIFWSLFGAGGMLSALTGPVLVFITGIAVPLVLFSRET